MIIQIKNLSKKFNDLTAVDDISFSVNKGDVFAFLGPNGAGKTTTIKMLTTLLRPTAGNIILDGHDPTKDANSARHSFGIVFQDSSLDDELTAVENMELHGVLYGIPQEVLEERTRQLLEIVELWGRRKEQVKNFSGGMKRRLEIARGLLHHPKILFLDEPTLGLDPQTRNRIWLYIKNLNQKEKTTVFFTTHYLDEAERNANRIAIIDGGKIIIQGTPDELKKETGTKSLEDAFIRLTGYRIREENSSNADQMRNHRRIFKH
ncbi:ATP-binding cassette domain-containing protein [Candidatus Uhrbacteria bacterium]|nr:ATP-binding cassette domain-containing protein [Candidatus Uhrbacteria bacterium]